MPPELNLYPNTSKHLYTHCPWPLLRQPLQFIPACFLQASQETVAVNREKFDITKNIYGY